MEELSVDRTEDGEFVWKVHGIRSAGCERQPRAAVRRVEAVPSILRMVTELTVVYSLA